MPLARLAALAGAIAAALALLPSPAAAAEPDSSATALAVLVRLPGGEETTLGAVSGPPAAFAALGARADGLVTFRAAYTDVRRSPGAGARAQARATIDGLSLLDGLVTVDSVTVRASAAAGGDAATGDLHGFALRGLAVAGAARSAVPNARVSLGELGYAIVLEQAVQRDGHRGFRGFAVALHVHLTSAYGGLPAGAELLVGYAEAAAEAPPPPGPPPPPPAPPAERPAAVPPPPPGARPAPPEIVRDPPAHVRPRITGRGYVFPVYGPASFSDDFGAARAATGWHHGIDVFAGLGAPVLAVADGMVFSVGWNPVGGWRLWLRDEQGNEYYYAHLSAYSPLAENGARVASGDVLGFVGDTGDAEGTPPHLHFEVHPAALLGLGYDGVVNAHPYLLAWRERRDESFGSALAAGPAPLPGAILVQADDISTVSGLEPGGILRALGLAAELPGLLTLPLSPALVGAALAF